MTSVRRTATYVVVALLAVLALAVSGVVVAWLTGWGCASEVDGRIVEHDCGQPPAGARR